MSDRYGPAGPAHTEVAGTPHPHLPNPTAWPMVLAVGIALVLGGFALSLIFSIGGAIVFAIALYGWIRELRREGPHE